MAMLLGLLVLPWWGYVLVTLGLTHVTIAAVTIFLHRHQAHQALTLHPTISHFFRFWLWLTTGMVTKEWTAIHRKHHATTDTADDPHSPQIYGIGKVLFEGTELYRAESRTAATLEKYGHGTPDDWIEHHLYAKHTGLGIGLLLAIEIVLFGPLGLSIWAVQMLWIPFFAAGVVNGLGHYWGYRTFATNDSSKNIVPWGVLIGGEELHNNHHAYVTSAKLSIAWWEFDVGWLYIRVLEQCHLAKVRKITPRLRYNVAKNRCDEGTLAAVITHRYAVLARFDQALHHDAEVEIRWLHASAALEARDTGSIDSIKVGLRSEKCALPDKERQVLEQALQHSPILSIIYSMRQDLAALCGRSTASKELRLTQLEHWCRSAEESGIAALREFSRQLRGVEQGYS
ncbi:fatty acid desaturase [Crenobacter sp. SG2303]|uniref:Fatty acid desaturase n=1 Tax=Crenobacter oryzisoli TaxID=3056844 RepID=A0ABT7XQT1_9NEIS|nr:fatty acid desaturase [Crenobacter sp. SG2303]MDN0076140.1 fatty acid desaturase [Crenobacter sp. SG2303]